MSVAAPRLRPATPDPRRGRPARPPAFWVFAALVVTALVVGIVSLSALLVRTSFRVDAIRQHLSALQEEHDGLAIDLVTASAPSRIAAWARTNGMIRAEDVHVLHVRAEAGG